MADSMQLLNVYDVETETGPSSLVCFLDPVLAGIRGIDPRAVVGPYGKSGEEEFDIERFQVNPAFVESLVGYMNQEASQSDAIIKQARTITSGWLYIVDPRDRDDENTEPPASNLLGAFAVDETGQVVPGSFQYNEKHALFDREQGPSGVLSDRKFYEWMHGI